MNTWVIDSLGNAWKFVAMMPSLDDDKAIVFLSKPKGKKIYVARAEHGTLIDIPIKKELLKAFSVQE